MGAVRTGPGLQQAPLRRHLFPRTCHTPAPSAPPSWLTTQTQRVSERFQGLDPLQEAPHRLRSPSPTSPQSSDAAPSPDLAFPQ